MNPPIVADNFIGSAGSTLEAGWLQHPSTQVLPPCKQPGLRGTY